MPKKKQSKNRSFVVISDLHVHPWASMATGDGAQNSRLRNSLRVLKQSLEYAWKHNIPWVFGGDLVHTAGYALNVVLSEVINVLGQYPSVVKLVVWGNHDSRGVGGAVTLEQTVWGALESAVENLVVLDTTCTTKWQSPTLSFSGVGAQPNSTVFDYAEPADVGIYHGTVKGSVGPNGHVFRDGLLDPAELLKRHRFVVAGDIHHPQQIDAPPGQGILVPGSPEHQNFGDVGEHGWWVVTIPEGDGNPEVEFMRSGSPEFRTVLWPRQVLDDGNFYRVISVNPGTKLPANAIAVAPQPTTVETRDVLRGIHGVEVLQAWLSAEPPAQGQGAVAVADYLAVGRSLLGSQEARALQSFALKRIALHNFCSYEDVEFVVRPGTWLVLGKGRDYPSNGAGKSTLFEGLFWLLFGRTTKGLSGDEVVRWGADTQAMVWGEFVDASGNKLLVVRKRGGNSTLEVEENGVPWEDVSVTAMTEKLGLRLGLTPALFQALAYFSQERLLLFAASTDGERKDMLGDLIGLAAYQDAATAASLELARCESERSACVGRLRALGDGLTDIRLALGQAEAQVAQWEQDRGARREEAEKVLTDFHLRLEENRLKLIEENSKHFLERIRQRQRELRDQASTASAQLAQPWPAPVSPEQAAQSRAAADAERAAMIRVIATREASEEAVKRCQRALEAAQEVLSTGVCPTCLQVVTGEHKQRCLAPAEADLKLAVAGLERLKKDEARIIPIAAGLKAKADQDALGVIAAQEVAKWNQVWEKAQQWLKELEQEEKEVDARVAAQVGQLLAAKQAELQAAVVRVQEEPNPHQSAVDTLRARLKEVGEVFDDVERTQRGLQRDIAVFDYWKKGFSKQGIQSLLMDEVAGAFNATRGFIIPALTQGVYDVQFSTLSRTKSGEARERTEFQVYERGKLVPYEALSGGQRRRIDVGVMLVLVKAVANWMQVPGVLGLLVLDEVFGFLDASGAEGLMEALREMREVVPTIFVVSHDAALQSLFSQVLVVEQDQNGVSRIVEHQNQPATV